MPRTSDTVSGRFRHALDDSRLQCGLCPRHSRLRDGKRLAIGRDWYEITAWNLTQDGHCKSCNAVIAGRFEGPAGTWGNRFYPVAMEPETAASRSAYH